MQASEQKLGIQTFSLQRHAIRIARKYNDCFADEQTVNYHLYIVSRVFQIEIEHMIREVNDNEIFGSCNDNARVVQLQKAGVSTNTHM